MKSESAMENKQGRLNILYEIPDEILVTICQYLDIKSQCELSVTSKDLRYFLSDEKLLWCQIRSVYIASDEYLRYRARRKGWLEAYRDGTLKNHDDWMKIDYFEVIIASAVPQPSNEVLRFALSRIELNHHRSPTIGSNEDHRVNQTFRHLVYIEDIRLAYRYLYAHGLRSTLHWQAAASNILKRKYNALMSK